MLCAGPRWGGGLIKDKEQAEAEVVPSSSLVEIEVWAGVGVEVFLLFRVGGWSGVEWLEKS